ncbi:MAG: rod shape-determining protein [Clostridia bacterium]|nr:rod shape-determining protein [Clostridia bacterium]
MFGADDLGLDLGTSMLTIVMRKKGIVLSEPCCIAYERLSRQVLAIGEEAARMAGRTPRNIIVERPFREGWIHSFDLVSDMLRHFMRQVTGRRGFRPRVLLVMPGALAPTERQTLSDIVLEAGAREVRLVDESVASAIGGGVDVGQQYGRMNVDIGGSRTNVSVFSLGHQIVWDILQTGGDRFDEAIVDYMRKKNNLLIGEKTAEQLKIDIGSAGVQNLNLTAEAYGRSLVSGLPRSVSVQSREMGEALDEAMRELMIALRRTLERTPPELASDIFDAGITLSGGGAKLYGLDKLITEQLNIETTLADEPELCTAHGLENLLEDPDRYDLIDLYSDRRRGEG